MSKRRGKRFKSELVIGQLKGIQRQLDMLELDISEFDTMQYKLIKKLKKKAQRLEKQIKNRAKQAEKAKIRVAKLKNELSEDKVFSDIEQRFIDKIKKSQGITDEEWDAAFSDKAALHYRLLEYYEEHQGTFYAASDGQEGKEDRNIVWRLDALQAFAKTVPGYTGEFERIYQNRLDRAVKASESVYSKIIPQGV